jgi:hypothetical protein
MSYSNLARGANVSFFFNQLQTAIFTSSWLEVGPSRKCDAARFPYSPLVRLIHRVTNLVGHSALIVALGFRTGGARRAAQPHPAQLRRDEYKRRDAGCKSEMLAMPARFNVVFQTVFTVEIDRC